MTNKEKMIEFVNTGSLNKFVYKLRLTFSDGTSMASWFKNNKKEILEANDELSNTIAKQYMEYQENVRENMKKSRNNSYNYRLSFLKIVQEFIDCNDDDKFNYNSKLTFNNGMNMYKWFKDNEYMIMTSKDETFKIIQKQKHDKELKDLNKKKLENSKKRVIFYNTKSLNKFNPKSNVAFSDGQVMGVWFFENEERIKNSKLTIDNQIMTQMDDYISFVKLKKLFLSITDSDKFNIDGNVRFASGALAYSFFELYFDEIMSSHDKVDGEIKKQYNEYLKNNNVKFIDSEEPITNTKTLKTEK